MACLLIVASPSWRFRLGAGASTEALVHRAGAAKAPGLSPVVVTVLSHFPCITTRGAHHGEFMPTEGCAAEMDCCALLRVRVAVRRTMTWLRRRTAAFAPCSCCAQNTPSCDVPCTRASPFPSAPYGLLQARSLPLVCPHTSAHSSAHTCPHTGPHTRPHTRPHTHLHTHPHTCVDMCVDMCVDKCV